MWIVVINAVHGQEISGPFFFNASCEIMFLSSQSVTAPRDLVIAGQIRWPWYALGFLLGNNKCLGNQKLIPQERGKKTCVIATFSDFTLRMMLNSQLGQKNPVWGRNLTWWNHCPASYGYVYKQQHSSRTQFNSTLWIPTAAYHTRNSPSPRRRS